MKCTMSKLNENERAKLQKELETLQKPRDTCEESIKPMTSEVESKSECKEIVRVGSKAKKTKGDKPKSLEKKTNFFANLRDIGKTLATRRVLIVLIRVLFLMS